MMENEREKIEKATSEGSDRDEQEASLETLNPHLESTASSSQNISETQLEDNPLSSSSDARPTTSEISSISEIASSLEIAQGFEAPEVEEDRSTDETARGPTEPTDLPSGLGVDAPGWPPLPCFRGTSLFTLTPITDEEILRQARQATGNTLLGAATIAMARAYTARLRRQREIEEQEPQVVPEVELSDSEDSNDEEQTGREPPKKKRKN